jgi:hypothetical protein
LTGGAVSDVEAARMEAMPLGGAAQGLFSLGEQYLAESPEALRQRYMNQQHALLEPGRMREEERLASSVFGRGRAGLNVGNMGQPELFALAQARREQDLSLAANAEQLSQQQLGYGASLFGTGASLLGTKYGIPTQALGPLQSYLGTAGTIEEMGATTIYIGYASWWLRLHKLVALLVAYLVLVCHKLQQLVTKVSNKPMLLMQRLLLAQCKLVLVRMAVVKAVVEEAEAVGWRWRCRVWWVWT